MINIANQFLQTNRTIKLRFPSSLTASHWAIEELHRKKLYAIPFIGALLVVGCSKPITKPALFEFISSKLNIKPERFENILQDLISKEIINFIDKSADHNLSFSSFVNWTESGWGDAAHYHFYNWDAPFLDYTKEGAGHDTDRKKMIAYQNIQPDTERYKKYEAPLENILLPSLNLSSTIDFSEINIISERIKYLLSYAFGKTGEKPCHWCDVPLIRRTSPSGGSRHPTEGYFLSLGLQEVKKGFYHIQTHPTALSLISEDASCSLNNFSLEEKSKVFPLGAIILTSVFERNMYRYREPRTFRTIHMDVGHILANIQMLGDEFKIKTCVHFEFNEKAILQKIGSSKFDEGIMAVITLHED